MATRLFIYIAVLLLAFVSSIRYYRQQELSLKIISILIGVTLVSECIAAFAGWRYGNNMAVYHFHTPVNLILTALYFNYSVPDFRKRHIGYYVGAVGIIAELFDTIYFQPFYVLDSHAVLFSGVLIVGMVLFSFYHIYINDNQVNIIYNPHFWLALLFLFFWCATFLIWALIQVLLIMGLREDIRPIYIALWVINILFYFGIGSIFLLLRPKTRLYGY